MFDYDKWLATDPYEVMDERTKWLDGRDEYLAEQADLQYGEDRYKDE